MERLIIIFLLLFVAPAWAALPPLSPEELSRSAEVVVEGSVVEVTSQRVQVKNGSDLHYTVVLKISKWVKGGSLKSETLSVFCRSTATRPVGWAGPSGQNDVPSKGDRGRFFLRLPASGIPRLLEPNGWKQLK